MDDRDGRILAFAQRCGLAFHGWAWSKLPAIEAMMELGTEEPCSLVLSLFLLRISLFHGISSSVNERSLSGFVSSPCSASFSTFLTSRHGIGQTVSASTFVPFPAVVLQALAPLTRSVA